MKQRFAVLAVLITLLQLNSFAQNPKNRMFTFSPLIAEDGISSITVSENVNVVLIQDKAENVVVKASGDVLSKLKVSVTGEDLFLAAAKGLKANERLTVYIWVNDLERLTLKGNAFAVSRGVLQSSNLHISVTNEAAVSIKSKGKVWFDATDNYQVVKENGFFFMNASTAIRK